ncbi:MAG: recombinase family protein [Ruminococcus sp.]|nr:recombinase family protein [Ruminococcus sp.]
MTVKTIEAQPAEKKKLRVAAYCRVSTDNDDQRESLETQKAHYEAWIRLHSDWECAGIFYDFGITGTKADVREGLQALLYECRIGRIDYVLTKSVSRFSRNTTDCLELVRELLSYNVPIYFEKEKLDTGSMETELVLAILSSLAQEESESISKNIKWANQKRIKNGRYRAGTAPYGYTFDSDGNYAIIPEEADVVRFIFESVVSGIGVHKIGKELDSRGVMPRRGGKWSTTTITGILNNEKYVGDVRYKKTYTDDSFRRHKNNGAVDSPEIKDHHEAIISRELYATAHNVLDQRLRERGIRRGDEKYKRRYAFSGKIICGECGSTFGRQNISSGISWCCKKHVADKDSCSMMFIHEESFQSAFTTMLNKPIFSRMILLCPYYNALRVAGSDENLQRIMSLKERIQKNADRKCELKKLRVKSIIDAVMYTQELNRIEKQNEEARREIQNLGNIESGLMLRETEKLLHFIDTADMQDAYNEELFLSFVDSIIVYSRDCIGFKLKCGLTLKEVLCTDTRS